MKKVIIIGSPGAGKSTFARKLSTVVGLSLYHLDMIWHKKDKTTYNKDEFDGFLKDILSKDEWIIDGNYSRTIDMRLSFCDTVFLLDFGTDVCLQGIRSRIGKQRTDLPWLETELDKEFENYVKTFSRDKLPALYEALKKYEGKRNIYVFKSREQADKFIQNLSQKK